MVDIVFPESINGFVEKFNIDKRKNIFTNLPELQEIEGLLKGLSPKNTLEIGAGLGRGSVFFFKYFGWPDTNFYLLDGNSGDVKVTGVREEEDKEFYSSIRASKDFCMANGLKSIYHLNAENDDWMKMFVKFDLVYSFLAIGFHWPIDIYLDDIYDLLEENALLIFGIRSSEERYDDFVNKQLDNIDKNCYNIVKIKRNPKQYRSSVLVLRKI